MSGWTAKLEKAARPVLEPGEQLLAGVRGMSAGATARIVSGAAGAVAGGAVGLVAASAGPGRPDQGDGRALPPQIALGLTDRRLLVFERGGLTGGARRLVAEIPRTSIAGIEGEDSGSKLKPDRLTVRLVDGSSVDFELVKADGHQVLFDAFSRRT